MKRIKKAPKMFSRFTSMFSTAVEALAPNLPLQQEFVAHWKAVTHYFIETKDHKVSVDQTALPHHLCEMMELLVTEERVSEGGSTGPCLEYLLHHKVLETLYTLARSDCPPGMKQVVLQFYTKLLSRISQPLLPHVNVHRPVQKMVRLCGDVVASPAETEEIQFVCIVCAKLKTDPYLVNFFIQSSSSNPAGGSGSVPQSPTESGASLNGPSFTIIESLLNLVESNDARVAVKACEGLMLCSTLPEDSAVEGLLQHTQFVSHLVTKLCTLYDKLPRTMDPSDVECVRAKWGLDFVSESDDQVHFSGKRQLISFLSWLDYCDQLAAVAHPAVAEALTAAIREVFIDGQLRPAILQACESGATTATAHMCQCVHVVSSTLLLNEFVFFLLGPPEPPGDVIGDVKVRDRLIDRCNHLSEELSVTTLKLFEILLHKPNRHIVETLVTQYLVSRDFVDKSRLPITRSLSNHSAPFSDVDSDLEQSMQLSSKPEEKQEENAQCDELFSDDDEEKTPESSQDSEEKKDDCDKSKDNSVDESSAEKTESAAEVTESPKEDSDTESSERTESTERTESSERTESATEQTESSTESVTNEKTESGTNESVAESETKESSLPEPTPELPSEPSPESCDPSLSSSSRPELQSQSSVDPELAALSEEGDLDPDDDITVHKIVNSFLCMLGEECKSSYQLGDSGYETYLRDAHRQFLELSAQCHTFSWQQPQTDTPTPVTTEATEPFSEGPFLKVLLDRLSHMLDQSYDVNLHVTSVISRLALLPHANIHEFLLHPMLPVKEGCRTLPKVLEKISHDIKVRVKPIPDYHKKLVTIRKQLMGYSESYRSKSMKPDSQCLDNANALTGVIVLEEFCKELAAIAFVKYHESAVRL